VSYRKPLTVEQKQRRAEYAREWRKKNPEKVAAHAKKTRIKNREKVRARQKEWGEKNKEHRAEKGRKWYNENKERTRNSQLIRVFGITLDEYNIMLDKQNDRCAICGENVGGKSFAVDHDHLSGKVRGLLCGSCNVGIGHFRDDPELLEKAIEYIKRFRVDL